MRTVFATILVSVVSVSAFAQISEKALDELCRRNIPYTEEAFINCVREGDDELADLFLTAGMDANAKDSRGEPVIVLAAREGHVEILKNLLEEGAKLADVAPTLMHFLGLNVPGEMTGRNLFSGDTR